MKILFVCSSNVCRSPYCEFVTRKLLEESPSLKDKGIEVYSSAVFNKSAEIHTMALNALKAEGFDESHIKAHRPGFKYKDKRKFEQADIIIGMSKIHYYLTPKAYRKKFVTLSELTINNYVKIPDPFLKRTQKEYDEVMAIIKEYLLILVNSLEQQFKDK